MIKWSTWLCITLLPLTAFTVPENIQLKYLVGCPVQESSQWSTTIQSQGSLWQLYKKAQVDLEVKAAENNSGIATAFPLTLQMRLKGLQVGADGSSSAHFDSDAPEQSIGMQEISKTLYRSIELTIGDNLQISVESEDTSEVVQELQEVGGFQIENLFSEMVQHLFALAGRDLYEGDTVIRQVSVPSSTETVSLEYKIVQITPQEVRATVQGTVPDWTMPVKQRLFNTKGSSDQITLSGTVSGKIVWLRSNALIYKAKVDYDYHGTIDADGLTSPISVQLHHLDSTSRL